MSLPPIVAVVGATASGKSELALDLAEALGGEIVNTDAMAVYRGMDVGTAKQPAAERRGIPHHLLDLLDVTEHVDRRRVPGPRASGDRRPARPRPGAGAGRRVGALHAGGAGPVRVPRHRRGRPRPARGRARRGRRRRPCTAGWPRSTPWPPRSILVDNGRRIVRALEVVEITGRPVLRDAAAPRVRRPAQRPGRRRHRPADARRADRAAGGARCSRRGSSRRSSGCSPQAFARAGRPASAIGYREVTAYLDGDAHPRRGARAHGRGDASVRAPPGLLVPQGPARRRGCGTTTRNVSRRRWRPWDHSCVGEYPFLKGHGTENDFVLLPDHAGPS